MGLGILDFRISPNAWWRSIDSAPAAFLYRVDGQEVQRGVPARLPSDQGALHLHHRHPHGDCSHDVLDIFVCILAFLSTGWGLLLIAQAIKPAVEVVGLWGSCPRVRDPHGASAVHAHRVRCVVPLRVGVPDPDALQPGLQRSAADLPDPRRAQEGPGHPEQGVDPGCSCVSPVHPSFVSSCCNSTTTRIDSAALSYSMRLESGHVNGFRDRVVAL